MIIRQHEAGDRCESAGGRCANCDKTAHSEVSEDRAGVLPVKQQRLLGHVLDTREQERASLANQIHDGLIPRMIGALLRLQAFEPPQQGGRTGAANEFHSAVKLLSDTVDEARRIASRLRPPTLDEFGVVSAIDYLVCEMGKAGQLEIEFFHDDRLVRPAPAMEIAAYRIVEELLMNAGRHSQTRNLRVELTQVDGNLRVEVQDRGIGFALSCVSEDRFGLQEVRQRAELLGGRTTIDSTPGQGTRVVIELPLAE